MSLRAEVLSHRVGCQTLLDTINLTLEPEEIMAIIGANGAGKSTLLSLFAGCPAPTQGKVLLDEKQLACYSADELARRRVVLTQSNPPAFGFSVADVVCFGALPHQAVVATRRIETVMEQVMRSLDIFALRSRSCMDLSGGEFQRVQLARVLLQAELGMLHDNVYALLDEPLSGLDLMHQRRLMACLRKLSSAGGSIAVVTHDLDIALQYADRVAFLKMGCLYTVGASAEVMVPETIREVLGVEVSIISALNNGRHVVVKA